MGDALVLQQPAVCGRTCVTLETCRVLFRSFAGASDDLSEVLSRMYSQSEGRAGAGCGR